MKKLLEKNSTIGLWLFIATLGLCINNLNNIVWANSKEDLIFTGGFFISFFMFIAGFLLMQNYQERKDNKQSHFTRAINYLKVVFSKLYPALLGGVLFAFLAKNAILGTKTSQFFDVFMNSIWEFLGLAQFNNGAISGTTPLWNAPLAIISAIIVCSFILYYMISKNEDLTCYLIIVLAILVYGFDNNLINFANGLFRVLASMGLGMLIYYIVDVFKNKKLNEKSMMILSIIHIGIVMFIMYTWFNGIKFNPLNYGIIMYLLLVVLLINNDYIAVLYNNFNLFRKLGKISLYYFSCHIVFIVLLAHLFPSMPYFASIIFNILYTFCWAIIMMYFDEYVITPLFRINKKEIKKKKIDSTKN